MRISFPSLVNWDNQIQTSEPNPIQKMQERIFGSCLIGLHRVRGTTDGFVPGEAICGWQRERAGQSSGVLDHAEW
jgi:hypothetical protein